MNHSKKNRLVIFIIIILVLNCTAYAQTPHMVYSTFLGGNSADFGHAIAVDSAGSVYIAGVTNSTDFPTTSGVYQRTFNNGDVFVSKLNNEGNILLYSTLVGGSGFDYPYDISVDQTGSAYVRGETYSSNFPTTTLLLPGNSSFFFFKLNPIASEILYSNQGAEISKVLVDDDSHIIVMGTTSSSDFPFTKNAYDTTYNGMSDIFIAKIDVEKDSIVFLTYLGGSGDDGGSSITFDSQKNLIITGSTQSADFPIKGSAFDTYTAGESQYFIAKLKSDGSDILFSIRVRSTGMIATDAKDNIYIAGTTSSNDLPVTSLAYDTSYIGVSDAYIMKLNSDCSQLIYATYIGGTSKDVISGFAVDKNEKVYIAGGTRSADFPVTSNAYDASYNGCVGCEDYDLGDVFFSIMDSTGRNLEYSTYLGTTKNDEVYGMTMDKSGNVYLVGTAYSSAFPTTAGAYQRSFKGQSDAYITKFSFGSTDVKIGSIFPSGYELKQNYPNPFNPTTVISYQLPAYNNVKLTIYNLLGQKVKTLVNSFQSAGEHSIAWDATDDRNNPVSSGVYFYKLDINKMSLQKKMVLVR